MTIVILPAKAKHAPQMLELRRASITELCFADHGDEIETLNEWRDNKTLDNMLALIDDVETDTIVAELDGQMAGLGLVNQQGRVLWNYVDPKFRFKGISKALMAAMENYIRACGFEQATLESSKTAFEFYKSCGWTTVETDGDEIEMIKIL